MLGNPGNEADCPPILIMLGRMHKRAMEGKGQFEVSSINESSIEDDLGHI